MNIKIHETNIETEDAYKFGLYPEQGFYNVEGVVYYSSPKTGKVRRLESIQEFQTMTNKEENFGEMLKISEDFAIRMLETTLKNSLK